jgi:L-alanine-DL-glutamate epimerase-like enolase superfamily enzyme
MGFQAYKMRPALGPDLDVEAVRQMRAATGPDFGLMVDAHSWWRMGDLSYSQDTVRQVAIAMADLDITWLEEPLPPEDHAAYRALRSKEIVPVATGEHEHGEEGFLDLIHTGCTDYVQMDVVCQGGYPMGRRLFAEIHGAGLRFAFHSWGTALELMAAAQVGICWPESVVEWLECPCYSEAGRRFMYEWPLASEILSDPLAIENGDLIVPKTPGLGVRVNEAVIERYPWKPGPWSYFSLKSPAGEFAVTSDHSVQWAGQEPA